jgi:hypothetical protein
MDRSYLINHLGKMINAKNYLEIGVEAGVTFNQVSIPSKFAVDPNLKVKGETLNGTFWDVTSDEFFFIIDPNLKFDLVFIDGLHTFEQSLKDLLNSIARLSEIGIIVVDDVYPSDYLASLVAHQICADLKTEFGYADRNWMGDVYRTIAFADNFLFNFEYASIKDGISQTVFWRSRVPRSRPNYCLTMNEIAQLDYASLLTNSEILKIQTIDQISNEIKNSYQL